MNHHNCTMQPDPMPEYTPGPWMRTGRGFCKAPGGATIGSCSSEADAALCAAAPDLLEALQELEEAASDEWGYVRPCVSRARRAIAKALAKP